MTLLDRAFSRRPFASVNPIWVQAVSDLWTETSVAFQRALQLDNGAGDFLDAPTSYYLTAMCHVEVNEKSPDMTTYGSSQTAIGPVAQRFWALYLPIRDRFGVALDPSVYPLKGDVVSFTTPIGREVELAIEFVTSPESILDHFEIATVEIT